MAKQDFAHVKAPSKNEAKHSAGGSVMPAIAILVVAGLCFSVGYWLGSADVKQTGRKVDVDAVEGKLAAQVAENKVLQAKNETLQSLVEQWKQKASQGAHTKVGELSFYKDLPKQSVNPAPMTDAPVVKSVVKPAVKPAPASGKRALAQAKHAAVRPVPASVAEIISGAQAVAPYRVQLASFQANSDAVAMQQTLSRAGFPSQVRKVDLGAKGFWFRLYAGPYASKSAANSARQQIEDQIKLKGFLVRGK